MATDKVTIPFIERTVQIQLGEIGSRNTRVVIDGKDVTRFVQSLTVTAKAGDVTQVALYLVPVSVSVTAPAEVQMFQPVALPLDVDDRRDVKRLRKQLKEAQEDLWRRDITDAAATLILEGSREEVQP